MKRAPPGSIATALTQSVCAWIVRTHAPSRHTLTVLSYEPVMMRPSGAAATLYTRSVCPASFTTSPENGRNFIASFTASQSWWHVGATAAISWASVSWYNTRPRASAGSTSVRQRAARRAARVVGIAASAETRERAASSPRAARSVNAARLL